ncbi:MAG: Crp/Fnr family transcriptional regulator [Pseudomonadota bacterium]
MAEQQFLNGLDPDVRSRLLDRMKESTHKRDEVVISQNDESLDIFFVLDGHARATGLSEEGKLVAYREIPEGAIFGELSAIDGRPRSANVVAVGPLKVGRITQSDFRDLVDTDSAVRWALLDYLTAQHRAMTDRIFEFSTMLVRDRLIAELLRLAEAAGATEGRIELHPAPTHFDLAARISTHREAVSREMSKFSRAKLVTKQLKTLIIHDVEALREQREDRSSH